MKELNFSILIHAPKHKVWEILWNDSTYRQWTKHFNPGSYMESDWQVGGRTLFLDADRNGMISTIKVLEAPNRVVFSYIGELNNGVEDTTSERVKTYAGGLEKYELQSQGNNTLLTASVQANAEYELMMTEGFTKGLQEVKQLSEN